MDNSKSTKYQEPPSLAKSLSEGIFTELSEAGALKETKASHFLRLFFKNLKNRNTLDALREQESLLGEDLSEHKDERRKISSIRYYNNIIYYLEESFIKTAFEELGKDRKKIKDTNLTEQDIFSEALQNAKDFKEKVASLLTAHNVKRTGKEVEDVTQNETQQSTRDLDKWLEFSLKELHTLLIINILRLQENPYKASKDSALIESSKEKEEQNDSAISGSNTCQSSYETDIIEEETSFAAQKPSVDVSQAFLAEEREATLKRSL